MMLIGDCLTHLKSLRVDSVNCVITSPPYFGQRDYGHAAQLGAEASPDAYVARLVDVFREVRRVLRDDGTVWLNLGDTYWNGRGTSRTVDPKSAHRRFGPRPQDGKPPPGIKPKDLVGIPWRVALALQADGWYLRQDIIWSKPDGLPEPVTDRCVRAHEYIFLLTKSRRYYFDADAIKVPAVDAYSVANGAPPLRGRRTVWHVSVKAYRSAHGAAYPEALVEPCVLAGCPANGMVLDVFAGTGTTGVVALRHGRRFTGIELNPAYAAIATERLAGR